MVRTFGKTKLSPLLTGISLLFAILLAIVFIIVASARWGWHPFFCLLLATLGLGLGIGLPPTGVLDRIREGFGGLLASVGLLIVLGSIIGVALERSGAAHRIADLLLGSGSRPGLRLATLGAVVSVPVFCDSGYIILAGLLPALAARSGKPVAVLALSLAGGLYLTHTLMPPTPGPLAAAANLGADGALGTIMLLAAIVCLPTLLVIWQGAARLGATVEAVPPVSEREAPSDRLPSASASLLPLLLPVLLIALGSLLRMVTDGDYPLLFFLFDPTVALLLGCGLALRLPHTDRRLDWIADALSLAGPILIITGLGGAFGAVLKASTLATDIASWMEGEAVSGSALLLLGFGIAALLKTAQGSSTGALVIASSVLFPLLPLAGFANDLELALMTLAIGAGAMTVSHANDSYFWVVTRFAGIEVGDAYRSYTVLTGVMGVTSFLTVLVVYWVSTLL
ncbi:GntP family permease [Lewinella sp. JB7]|uniref:GntP family permease n=1 Tax=Lewinella sp. JB7 TaxID=2962887 RepID=UPI0020C9796C|nr:hypothetical protein [Lewinella sp. JB7]MCP9237091.1 hypothetical protein [Lewinella sp. JB7]